MPIRQFSTIDALMMGHYYGAVSVEDALKLGNLGLGVRAGLDGECLILDGRCYVGQPGGQVVPADPKDELAFVTLGDFSMAGTLFQANEALDFETVKQRADEVRNAECASDNIPCICRIDGRFGRVLVRSFRAQEAPYRPLSEVAKEQVESEAKDIEGTLLGFWFPRFVSGINQEGWHFHFISRDRKTFGGHCLECSLTSGLIGCRKDSQFSVTLPETKSFAALPLGEDLTAARDSVENSSQSNQSN